MKLKFFANLALSLCLVAQLNFASAAKEYDEEITLPVGTNFDLEMDEISRYEYDGNFVDARTVNGKEEIILKKTGDTIINVIMEEDGQKTEMKILVHIVTNQQFENPKAATPAPKTNTPTKATPKADVKQPATAPAVTTKAPAIAETPATKKPNKVVTKNGISNAPKEKKQPNKVIKINPDSTKAASSKPAATKKAAADVTTTTAAKQTAPQIHGTPVARPADTTPANTLESAKLKTQNFCFDVLDLVNSERTKASLSPLTMTKDLSEAALVRAKELPKRFSNTRPDNTRYFTVLTNKGTVTEENIAAGQTTANAVVKAWMASSKAKANILNPKFKELGVGYVETVAADFPCYWVQLFRG